MTKEQYRRISAPFRTPARRKALIVVNAVASCAVYAAYILSCMALLILRDPRLIAMVLICGIPFVAVTLIRAKINAPRPYQVLDIVPLIPKAKQGESFPSRHVFSCFVIAVASLIVSPALAAAVGICGAVLAFTRVIGGVHFPKDVIAGAAIGIACGSLGVWLWQILEANL